MAKGTRISQFEKGEITALKRVKKSQSEISKALGRSKTVICNDLKSPNKYRTRNRPEDQENYHYNSREEFFAK